MTKVEPLRGQVCEIDIRDDEAGSSLWILAHAVDGPVLEDRSRIEICVTLTLR